MKRFKDEALHEVSKQRPLLHRNGLLEELANSFLVIASASDADSISHVGRLLSPTLLAAGYSAGRRHGLRTQTKMVVSSTGEIAVEKTTISNAREQALSEFEHVDCVEPYVKGPQLDQVIVEALIHDGLDAALLQLLRWVHYLVANGLEVKDENDLYNSTLKPGFFDCIIEGIPMVFIRSLVIIVLMLVLRV